jgi:hypothetical protein
MQADAIMTIVIARWRPNRSAASLPRINDYFGAELYAAASDGDVPPLATCRACGFGTYVMSEEENSCAYCEDGLTECGMCSTPLTPFNVSPDSDRMCDYCAHILSKD